LICNGAAARAVPCGSDGLAQDEGLIHRSQGGGEPFRADLILLGRLFGRFGYGQISDQLGYEISPKQPRGGAASLRRAGDIRRSSAEVSSIRMAVVLRRVSSNAAAHLKLLEDRAPLSGKLDELNADESSLDRVQAEPFFVRHLAL
jgi:hypothetical protein